MFLILGLLKSEYDNLQNIFFLFKILILFFLKGNLKVEFVNLFPSTICCSNADDGIGAADAPPRALNDVPVHVTTYFFHRWMWIHFPYIALGNCNQRSKSQLYYRYTIFILSRIILFYLNLLYLTFHYFILSYFILYDYFSFDYISHIKSFAFVSYSSICSSFKQ